MMERDLQIARYLGWPWTVRVSRDEENGFVATVDELPDAIATADTAEEIETEFWAALRASIHARLVVGEPIPRPARLNLHRQESPLLVDMVQTDEYTTVASGGLVLA